jgi:micrococcal nuclease
VDAEGTIVWAMEYLRYRVDLCLGTCGIDAYNKLMIVRIVRPTHRNRVLAAVFVVLFSAAAQGQRPVDLAGQRLMGKVVHVVDGDTVDVMIPPSRTVRVRLEGVDTPEAGEAFSTQATRFSRALLFERQVTLAATEVDVYGRLVARVLVEGVDSSEAILKAGLGCTITRFVNEPALNRAQADARQRSVGFWAHGVRRPSCAARELNVSKQEGALSGYVGNTRSRVYHVSTCRQAHCHNCTREFATRAEADKAGYRPAGDCLH